jgi:hypothetical protein
MKWASVARQGGSNIYPFKKINTSKREPLTQSALTTLVSNIPNQHLELDLYVSSDSKLDQWSRTDGCSAGHGIPSCYGKFIIMFIRAHHWALSWIQSTVSHPWIFQDSF